MLIPGLRFSAVAHRDRLLCLEVAALVGAAARDRGGPRPRLTDLQRVFSKSLAPSPGHLRETSGTTSRRNTSAISGRFALPEQA